MKIGNVDIGGNITLAPLAGYTDIAFRRLCRDFGASLTVTEMISVSGLNYRNKKTNKMTQIADNETPSCVQLFGSEPDQFARAAGHHGIVPFDIIDVNMGCPVRKVLSNREGAALMDDTPRACAIVKALKNATDKPITVKMRLGRRDNTCAVEFAQAIEAAGADMLTVHGRTAVQMYSGTADWDKIREVAAAVSIPVMGNGDADSDNIAEKMNGVSGVAIGRGAVGNPQIFGEKRFTVYEIIMRHIGYVMEYFDGKYLCSSIRKFFPYYFKGIRGSKPVMCEIMVAKTHDQFMHILERNKELIDII